MDKGLIAIPRVYTALTIVSPMMCGDEAKDQDRARFYGPGLVACVCDGVTSSPYSAQAAEFVTSCIPSLFAGRIDDRLGMISDNLMAKRLECQESDDIKMPANTPLAMQAMLKKVILQKRTISFQTTLIAARFISEDNNVLAEVVKCGDSAFFAFSPDGQLLSSSLAFLHGKAPDKDIESFRRPKRIFFGPGDEILVRIESELSQNKMLLKRSSIKPDHASNWIACTAVDTGSDKKYDENFLDLKVLVLNVGDVLLVPKYLYGTQLTSQGRQYLVLRYSSTIRPVLSAPAALLNNQGSATKVLPDHFYSGCYDSFRDSFPKGTNFILCSDGFYNSFSDWHQLWQWLEENKTDLHDAQKRESVLAELHSMLNSRMGDDDISFVWAKPCQKE